MPSYHHHLPSAYRHYNKFGRMYCFKAGLKQQQLLRVYALKHCYEEARVFEKSKGQNPPLQQVAANCIIVRKGRVRNQSDFGYKEELKTNILKKMYFVYLQTTEDLIAFLWKHSQEKEPQFGLLLVQDAQLFFGDHFQYRECGPAFLIFIKLLKQLTAKLRIKGRIAFSYAYREEVFHKAHFEEFLRAEDATDWQVAQGEILKCGYPYESDLTKQFFTQYGTQLEPKPQQDHK